MDNEQLYNFNQEIPYNELLEKFPIKIILYLINQQDPCLSKMYEIFRKNDALRILVVAHINKIINLKQTKQNIIVQSEAIQKSLQCKKLFRKEVFFHMLVNMHDIDGDILTELKKNLSKENNVSFVLQLISHCVNERKKAQNNNNQNQEQQQQNNNNIHTNNYIGANQQQQNNNNNIHTNDYSGGGTNRYQKQ